ncbi:MAG TPA: transcription-repair coupling factor, partial [Pirellulaceae bacterium]|nr:transcription-repair coupling factor [Pirellulaceae bacterium]
MGSATTATSAAERLRELARCLEAQNDFAAVLQALANGQPAIIDGVWGSSCALAAATLAARAPSTLLVVSSRIAEIDVIADDLELFSASKIVRFPAWETPPSEHRIRDDIYGERLRTLKSLLEPVPPRVIACSIQSLLQSVPPRRELAAQTRRLRLADRLDVEPFLKWLVSQGFHSTSAVELPGEFSLRGGILDLFAPDWSQPVRLELFDDEIESLRRFDIASQRSLERLDAIDVTVLKPDSGERVQLT